MQPQFVDCFALPLLFLMFDDFFRESDLILMTLLRPWHLFGDILATLADLLSVPLVRLARFVACPSRTIETEPEIETEP